MDWKEPSVPRDMPSARQAREPRGQPRGWLAAIACALLAAPGTYPQSAGSADGPPPDPVPVEQPLPYSHKTHVALGLQCRDCHEIADPGFAAGYPAEVKCMACHVAIKADSPHIQQLAQYSADSKPVPWNRVYRVPDFVWFSHASHVDDASVGCETCHGDVAQREALFQEKPTTMASCMECHARHQAPNDCDFCHDPG